ncbi:MAG TPA: 3'-5' exonuclease [Patescibacteria group bacterium]|nr:3'-5' exonuclease [Patescibacteria group bacterium]
MSDVIFYDTEFTTWEGAMERDWSGPNEYRELVQIGAVRFDRDTLVEKEEFLVLIKPVKNPLLSEFFTQLTGITNEHVARDGLAFPDAYDKFLAFTEGDETSCYGWDARVMRENLAFNGMPASEAEFDSHNIGPWFFEVGAPYGIIKGKTNSGRLAATLGAPITSIQEHNALHDARSIAAAYRFLIQKGAKSPFDTL